MSDSKTISELLRRYQEGDATAFKLFFDMTSRYVFNFLLLRIKNRADAEDAFQEVFFRIHRYISSYDPNKNGLGWVFSIARNVGHDFLASKISANEVALPEHLQSSSNFEANFEARQFIEQISKSLGEDDQDLLFRRFFLGEDYAEIAGSKEISEETARQRISRLFKKLKFKAP